MQSITTNGRLVVEAYLDLVQNRCSSSSTTTADNPEEQESYLDCTSSPVMKAEKS